jgi:hypothetical protein
MFDARRAACLTALFGCTGSPIDLSNNGPALIITTTPDADIEQFNGVWPKATLELVPCDGTEGPVAPLGNVNLSESVRVSLKEGTWCALELSSEEPMAISGSSVNGSRFDLTLQIDSLILRNGDGFEISNNTLVIRLGANPWPTYALFPGASSSDTNITPEEEAHDDIIDDLAARTYVFDDIDGDKAEDAIDPVVFAGSPIALGLRDFP